MLDKKIIKKELSVLHFILLFTSKLLIGVGIGLIIATHFWHAQPYWYLLIIFGVLILAPTLFSLLKAETKEEIALRKRMSNKK